MSTAEQIRATIEPALAPLGLVFVPTARSEQLLVKCRVMMSEVAKLPPPVNVMVKSGLESVPASPTGELWAIPGTAGAVVS